MITLSTERLTMRPFREEDLDVYAAMCADAEVMRFLGGKTWTRMEACRAFYLHHAQPNLRAEVPATRARCQSVHDLDPGRTIESIAGMQFVLLPTGEFLMGSSEDVVGREPREVRHLLRETSYE